VLSRHRVGVNLAPDLPLVRLDPVLFEQVLFNLLDNAAKYAPAGTSVALDARKEGNQIRIDIRDEGAGVPPADLERIFDKFYRIQAGDRKRAGTGLGLPICRGFVEAMGGTIKATNRMDRSGADFVILLPSSLPEVPGT
jgi:two-component system sensor histidine kinase KdpD